MAINIGLDAGHGGNDSGAVNSALKLKESDITLKISNALATSLKNAGFEVKQDRTNNNDAGITADAAMFSKWGANLVISIHCNSATVCATGIECWYADGNDKGKRVAELLSSNIASSTGLPNRGAKNDKTCRFGSFAVCRQNKLAVLLETGFLSNPNDIDKALDSDGIQRVVKGVVTAVETYFGKQKIVSNQFKEYNVTIPVSALNYRKGPGKAYGVAGVIRDKAAYTIVSELAADGVKWGKLKSGAGWIDLTFKDVEKAPTTSASYIVKVTASALNVRKGPDASYTKVGMITDKGSYTITETKNGWGKLKSGSGWIDLAHTKKV